MFFPGLDRGLITKHLPPSTATAKGHMTRTRKGLRSTQDNRSEILDARAIVNDMTPVQQMCTAIDDEMYCYSVTTDNDGDVLYSDLAGRFPVESYAGMNYFFIAYVYKCNYIIVRAMKGRNDEHMIATFREVYDEIKTKGYHPKIHVLDNECSRAVKKYTKSEKKQRYNLLNHTITESTQQKQPSKVENIIQ